MKLFLYIAVILLSMGCNAQVEETQDTPPTATSTTEPLQASANLADWPTPNRYAGNIPVYEKYADIAPLFELNNDTTYVINFWATWCKPCVQELPYFEQLNEKHKDSKVKVVLISLDFPKQVDSKLVPYVEKNELQSAVVALLDGKYNDWIDKVSPEWSGAIPATLFYQGSQRHFLGHSVESTAELEEILNNFIH